MLTSTISISAIGMLLKCFTYTFLSDSFFPETLLCVCESKTKMRIKLTCHQISDYYSTSVPVYYNDSLKSRLLDGYLFHQVGETESVIKNKLMI